MLRQFLIQFVSPSNNLLGMHDRKLCRMATMVQRPARTEKIDKGRSEALISPYYTFSSGERETSRSTVHSREKVSGFLFAVPLETVHTLYHVRRATPRPLSKLTVHLSRRDRYKILTVLVLHGELD